MTSTLTYATLNKTLTPNCEIIITNSQLFTNFQKITQTNKKNCS